MTCQIYNEVIYDLLDPSKTLKKAGRGLDIKVCVAFAVVVLKSPFLKLVFFGV